MKTTHFVIAGMMFCFCTAPISAQQQVRGSNILVSQGVTNALLLKRVMPTYTDEVKSVNISGQIVLAITIDKTGKVTHPMVVDKDYWGRKSVNVGDPHLRQTSLDAVKQWTYRPYLLQGAPVDIDTSVVLLFDFSHPSSPIVKLGEPPNGPPPSTPASNALDAGKASLGEFGKPLIEPKIAESRLTGRVEPQYPQMAKIAHIQGDVVLHILIDKEGHVVKVKQKSGHPILIQAAIDAVSKWDYQPFLLNGHPTDVESSVTVKFRP
ncbi:MAG: energy transducer TonB [Candidatus Angelobacter sp.]